MELNALVLRYVAERKKSGAISATSASGIRRRLFDFADNAPANPTMVRRKHVQSWIGRPENSAGYNRQKLSTLRVFCKWCTAHRYMKLDPTLLVETPRMVVGVPKRLLPEEARLLRRSVMNDPRLSLIVSLELQ